MKKAFRTILTAAALLTGSCACGQSSGAYIPGSLKENPKNIVTYLEENGIKSYYGDKNDGHHFDKKCLEELQKFNEGKRKFYPTKEVNEILGTMQNDIMYCYMHSDDIRNHFPEFYSMIDVAVNLCPDINLLSHRCSSDHVVGILDFPNQSHETFYRAVMCKVGDKKFRAHTLELLNETDYELEKVRKISESNGKKRYIISNEKHLIVYVLEIAGNGKISSWKPANEENVAIWFKEKYENEGNYKDIEIRYNPKKICWEFCYRAGDIFKRVEGTRALHIEFTDGKPAFILKK